MAISKDQKTALEKNVRTAYDDFQDKQRGLKEAIKERVEAEFAQQTAQLKLEFSKMLHDMYARGLSKAAMKRATRKYTNQVEWLKLWDAYTPPEGDVPLTTQTARVVDEVDGILTYSRLQGADLTQKISITNPRWEWSLKDGDFIPTWNYPDMNDWRHVSANSFLEKALRDDVETHYLGDKPENTEDNA